MSLTCRQLADLLMDYVSNGLSDDQKAILEQHLGDCTPCVATIHAYKITLTFGSKLPPRPMPPRLVAQLQVMYQQARDNNMSPPESPPTAGA